jgi:hypothetical protein
MGLHLLLTRRTRASAAVQWDCPTGPTKAGDFDRAARGRSRTVPLTGVRGSEGGVYSPTGHLRAEGVISALFVVSFY